MFNKNILSIDTSTDFCFIGLYNNGNLFKFSKKYYKNHSENILCDIDKILYINNIKLNEINAIACVCGPGSFTGTKIGVGISKGLSLGLKIPIIKISSLSALAEGSYRINKKYKNILSAIQTYSKLIYWSTFCVLDNGILKKNSKEKISYSSEIIKHLNNSSSEWIFSGSMYIDYIKKILNKDISLYFSGIQFQCITDVINLSLKLLNSKKTTTSDKICPIYLY